MEQLFGGAIIDAVTSQPDTQKSKAIDVDLQEPDGTTEAIILRWYNFSTGQPWYLCKITTLFRKHNLTVGDVVHFEPQEPGAVLVRVYKDGDKEAERIQQATGFNAAKETQKMEAAYGKVKGLKRERENSVPPPGTKKSAPEPNSTAKAQTKSSLPSASATQAANGPSKPSPAATAAVAATTTVNNLAAAQARAVKPAPPPGPLTLVSRPVGVPASTMAVTGPQLTTAVAAAMAQALTGGASSLPPILQAKPAQNTSNTAAGSSPALQSTGPSNQPPPELTKPGLVTAAQGYLNCRRSKPTKPQLEAMRTWYRSKRMADIALQQGRNFALLPLTEQTRLLKTVTAEMKYVPEAQSDETVMRAFVVGHTQFGQHGIPLPPQVVRGVPAAVQSQSAKDTAVLAKQTAALAQLEQQQQPLSLQQQYQRAALLHHQQLPHMQEQQQMLAQQAQQRMPVGPKLPPQRPQIPSSGPTTTQQPQLPKTIQQQHQDFVKNLNIISKALKEKLEKEQGVQALAEQHNEQHNIAMLREHLQQRAQESQRAGMTASAAAFQEQQAQRNQENLALFREAVRAQQLQPAPNGPPPSGYPTIVSGQTAKPAPVNTSKTNADTGGPAPLVIRAKPAAPVAPPQSSAPAAAAVAAPPAGKVSPANAAAPTAAPALDYQPPAAGATLPLPAIAPAASKEVPLMSLAGNGPGKGTPSQPQAEHVKLWQEFFAMRPELKIFAGTGNQRQIHSVLQREFDKWQLTKAIARAQAGGGNIQQQAPPQQQQQQPQPQPRAPSVQQQAAPVQPQTAPAQQQAPPTQQQQQPPAPTGDKSTDNEGGNGKPAEESKKRKEREDSPETDDTNYFDAAWMAAHQKTMQHLKTFQKSQQKLNDAVQASFKKLGAAEEHQEALEVMAELSQTMENVADAMQANLAKRKKGN